MSTIRTFIAIELSDEAQQAISLLQNRLQALAPPRTVRWSAPQNIHLTLHFLGEIAVADVERVTGVVQKAAEQCVPFTLTIGGLGSFPNSRRPRIIWVGLPEKSEPLLELHHLLGAGLQTATDFRPETRPYSPHLTIGRVKKNIPPRQLNQVSQVIHAEQAKVGKLARLSVSEISVIKSELKPAGPVYTQLSRGEF